MPEKKERYPPAFVDEGGVQIPYVPTAEEVENCAFAERDSAKCLRIEESRSFGAPTRRTNCSVCSHHPHAYLKRAFTAAK